MGLVGRAIPVVSTTYTVYRNIENVPGGAVQVGTPTTDTIFIDDDPTLLPGMPYYYWVEGTNSCGTSPFSLSASGSSGELAVGPTNVIASDIGESFFCDQVVITWLPSATADSYMVYRSITADPDDAEMLQDNIVSSSYVDTSALPVVTYTYWIVSVTTCGQGAIVDVDNSDTGSLGQLAPPTDVAVNDPLDAPCGSAVLTWTPVSGASGYGIYRATNPTFPGVNGLIGLGQGDSYTDNDLDVDEFDVPLYYWMDSRSQFCAEPDTYSTNAEGSARPPITSTETSFTAYRGNRTYKVIR